MKKKALITLFIAVSCLTLTSFKSPKKLVGQWSVVKLENSGVQKHHFPFDWVAFKKDGIIEIGRKGRTGSGTWTYNNDKSIKMVIEETEEHIVIQELSRKKLIIKDKAGMHTMYLEKNN